MAQPDIRAAVEATGRDCFVLAGLETDVCIAHSALGLSATGQRAVVIDDACASPPPHHEHGLRRLRDAGVTVTSVKGIFYEWVRDLETYRHLQPQLNAALPEGLTL
jgi:nicotinamidase-related amidase